MAEKQWRSCRFMINGMAHKVQYNEATIYSMFVPLLRQISRRQKALKRRFVIFMAAPPGTGKSTLSLLLEQLSQTDESMVQLQSLGMDGFHYPASYIRNHSVKVGEEEVPMAAVKGCPETFDLVKLKERLARLHTENVRWPVYDRTRHDVIEDVISVKQDIVLVEGNWLLLGTGGWQELRAYADYTIFIKARPGELKERLVERKMRGGKTRAEAEAFYERSDKRNVERVLRDSWPADETWELMVDGDYKLVGRTSKVKLVDREVLWQKPEVKLGDSPLLNSLARRMSQLTPADKAEGKGAYEKGFLEGLLTARDGIIRRLHKDGVSEQELSMSFELKPSELEMILKKQ